MKEFCKERSESGRAFKVGIVVVYSGSHHVCERCFTRHVGQCTIKCHKCGKVGHKARYCKEKNVAMGANAQPIPTCYDCGSDRSFMNTRFSSMLNIEPVKIRASYEVELADERAHDVVIVYGKKVVRIPYGNKTLIVESDKGVSQLKVIYCIKAQDVPAILDFPEVFPDDLPGLPPLRQVDFRIDLVPGAAPVARAPYRLEQSEMRELSIQLQELLEKGFICPSSSP
ncbi:putative reverse transcriptase domain-containing protein [Tanacetum coccineum]